MDFQNPTMALRNLLKELQVVRQLTAPLRQDTKEAGVTHREVTFLSNSGEAALHQVGKEVAPGCIKDLDMAALACTTAPIRPPGVVRVGQGLHLR